MVLPTLNPQSIGLLEKCMFDPDALLNESAAAEFLGLTIRFLQSRRSKGESPPFIRISHRCIRYRRRDLIAWAEERKKNSTSEYEENEVRELSTAGR